MGFLHSLASEFLIRESLSSKVGSDHTETVRVRDEVLFGSAIIVAEHLFIKVAKKMKRLDRNVSPFQSAFQETPEIFESVCVNLSVHIGVRVIDDVVNVFVAQSEVCAPFIGRKLRSRFHVFSHYGLNGMAFAVLDNFRSDMTTTFKNANHDGLSTRATFENFGAFGLVHETGLTADKGFINFDVPGQFSLEAASLHCFANAMHHEPCGFLRDAKIAGNLVAADSVLASSEHPRCRKPFVQAQRRILIDAANLDRKLPMVMSTLALPFALSRQESYIGATAYWTRNDTIRPAFMGQILDAGIGVIKQDDRFLQCSWLFDSGFHESNYRSTHVDLSSIFLPLLPISGLLYGKNEKRNRQQKRLFWAVLFP